VLLGVVVGCRLFGSSLALSGWGRGEGEDGDELEDNEGGGEVDPLVREQGGG